MQALSDDQRVEALETKVEEGFARMDEGFADLGTEQREMREDLRQMRGQMFASIVAILGMWLTLIPGFAGIVIGMLAHG